MPVIPITSLDDPRVAPYRNVKDRELARDGDRFIAEGEHVVLRLLASDYQTESVLLSDRRAEELAPRVPEHIPAYVVPHAVMEQVLGIKFHAGVIACGIRRRGLTLDRVIPPDAARLTIVICPDIANVQNIGSIIRLSAGFGVDAMILGRHCHDPFFRQSIRVSMGTIFKLPLLHTDDLVRDLRRLREHLGVELAATVLDESAEPLAQSTRPARFGLMFGNEAQGLDRQWIDQCQRRITIPMKLGTDSLNVAVAAGIFLYHFTR